jgi:CelD/BcsL family acetyltransferase involved in cellulose biosynthesis
MELLSLAELDARVDDFDRAVAATPGIDHFCSSSAWALPAAAALMPPRRSWIHRGDHGWLAAMMGHHASGLSYVEPLELAWGLAAPLVGPDPQALADEVAAHLATARGWSVLLVPGYTADGPVLRALLAALPPRWERRWGQPTIRHVASLDGGIDGFLGRRSRNFRKSLRASLRDAEAAGFTFEHAAAATAAEADRLYERVLAIEARSWKAREGVGITASGMRDFYQLMLRRLAPRGWQRTVFARRGDQDHAYVLGAVWGGEYRGLQFSYDDDWSQLSLGSLCQYHQILGLCAEGVERYDLGTDMEYKRRWAEAQFETTLLVVVAR